MPTLLASWDDLISRDNATLAKVDPVEMNLLVAKGLPSLAHLHIPDYQEMADDWAADIARRIPAAERAFHQSPQDWKNDINFFRLGVAFGYLDRVLGICYREDQREVKEILYTDPSDMFLNGVMDGRRGTCGNMAALHVAIGWRFGWPVSLACVKGHYICRYDDGKVTHNIETTKTGDGGFHSHPDEYYIAEYKLSPTAIRCGSDLRAVTPREMLGCFIVGRARHLRDTGHVQNAEVDYLLARYLFPMKRYLFIDQIWASVQMGSIPKKWPIR